MPELDRDSQTGSPTQPASGLKGGDIDFGQWAGSGSGTTRSGGGSSGPKGASASGKGQYMQGLVQTYLSLWGLAPPPGYVERIAASGMNIFEFEAHERAKPAFDRSMRYQEERLQTELEMARYFGALG